jgi:hypothetical protein
MVLGGLLVMSYTTRLTLRTCGESYTQEKTAGTFSQATHTWQHLQAGFTTKPQRPGRLVWTTSGAMTGLQGLLLQICYP